MSVTVEGRDSFTNFLNKTDEGYEYSLSIINRTRPASTTRLLEKTFADIGADIEISDVEKENITTENLVALEKNGVVTSVSDIEELERSLLLVNSDLYRTGSVSLNELETPDVLLELADTTFTVRGYPQSAKEKLLLIYISRYIEKQSYTYGGTHHASFQYLSRINDERGTKKTYQKLSDSGVETNIYGIHDISEDGREQLEDNGINVHYESADEYSDVWFVSHLSAEKASALVAVETGDNVWNGKWTFNREEVQEINSVIETTCVDT